jgi:phage tail-like protein
MVATANAAALVSRPFTAFHYYVEIMSVTEAIFSECTGLQVEMEVYEYKEGGYNTHIHRLPGRAKAGNITLKRGIARPPTVSSGPWDSVLWKWYCDVLRGQIVRHNFSILLIDPNVRQEVARWNVYDAYPVKWIGPTFKATDSAAAIETLELAHRGLQLL